MKAEARLLIFLGVFIGIMGIVYGIWSKEWGGTAMLIGTAILGIFPGLYYHWWSKRIGYRPEDRDATMEEGAGRIDTFPGSSIWPFTLGIGCWFLVLALVFGTWFAVIGLPVVMFALAGGTAESRRGGDPVGH
ncbi:MAG: cytochrome c oxidase subunit 4 [Actinomycetota bacterium]